MWQKNGRLFISPDDQISIVRQHFGFGVFQAALATPGMVGFWVCPNLKVQESCLGFDGSCCGTGLNTRPGLVNSPIPLLGLRQLKGGKCLIILTGCDYYGGGPGPVPAFSPDHLTCFVVE